MEISARQLAEILGGSVEGDPSTLVHRPAKIEEATMGSLTFLANPKYEAFAYTTQASILLASRDFRPHKAINPTIIRVDDVYASMALLMEQFAQSIAGQQEVKQSPNAEIHPDSTLDDHVSVGAFSIIEAGVQVGAHTTIYPQVYIGKNAKIGKHVTLYPGVKIYHDCVIGDHCIVHANAVIGADGFGFAPQSDGSYRKVPQLGNVVLEDHVEIGAGATIDRATMGSTILMKGVKIDNLVMVAHNVSIGQHTAVAAQSGIAGSTSIGAFSMLGGQTGIAGHLKLADRLRIQAQSGVNKSIEQSGTALYGSPALPYRDFLKAYAIFRRLPELEKRLDELEADKTQDS